MAVRICCLYVANVSRVIIDTRKAPELESGAFLIRQGLVPRLVAVVPLIELFSYVIGYASQEGEDKETAKEESP